MVHRKPQLNDHLIIFYRVFNKRQYSFSALLKAVLSAKKLLSSIAEIVYLYLKKGCSKHHVYKKKGVLTINY